MAGSSGRDGGRRRHYPRDLALEIHDWLVGDAAGATQIDHAAGTAEVNAVTAAGGAS